MEYRDYRYRTVDVFADRPFSGNPIAVFTDARGLADTQMQMIARELNRTQTSFVFPAESDDAPPRVRIFTPQAELPHAGSPTIGAVFAMSCEAGEPRSSRVRRTVVQGGDGPVSVSAFARILTVRQPAPTLGAVYEDTDAVMATLGLTDEDRMPGVLPQAAASTVPLLVVPVRRREALERIHLRRDIWERTIRSFEAPKLLAFTLETERASSTAKLRVFAPDVGVAEDPATESACGPLSAYLVRHGFASAESPQMLVFEQGKEVDRPSFMHVAIVRSGDDVTSVRVGGHCVSVGEGVISAHAMAVEG